MSNNLFKYIILSAIIFSPSLFFHSRQVFLLYPVEIFFYSLFLNYLENNFYKFYLIFNTLFIAFSLLFTTYGILTGVEIGYQVLSSVFETNYQEVKEFFTTLFFKKYLLIYFSIFSIFIYLLSRKYKKIYLYKSKKIALLSIPFIFIFTFHTYKHFYSYPENVFEMFYTYFIKFKSSINNFKSTKYTFNGKIDKKLNSNIILVIGEASRKANYQLYGYKRETTPLLDSMQDRLIVFQNMISVSRATRVSVPMILSTTSMKNYENIFTTPTLLKIFNTQKEYNTAVISNQTMHLSYDVLINLIFSDAKYKFYLQSLNNKYFDKIFYDKDLLPYIDKYIKNKNRYKFLVVHLAGSHYQYNKRYPKEFNYFKKNNNIDKYDNSIRHTDYVLHQIIKYIKNRKEPYLFLYTSDHGEYLSDFGDNLYGHGIKKEPTKYEYEVPFFIYANNSFKKIHKNKIKNLKKHILSNISHDNISHTILGLCGIYPKEYRKNLDLSSKDFKESERYFALYSLKGSQKFDNMKKRVK